LKALVGRGNLPQRHHCPVSTQTIPEDDHAKASGVTMRHFLDWLRPNSWSIAVELTPTKLTEKNHLHYGGDDGATATSA
jgi:hypothetical protein